MARSTAPRFITGSTPGRARSTGLAWVLGSAPKAIALPLKIFELVVSCTWFSRPMTTSHCMVVLSYECLDAGRGAAVPVGDLLVLVGDAQQLGFSKIITDDLQADGALAIGLARTETAGDGHAGQAGQAGRQGKNIGQVVGDRVVGLLARFQATVGATGPMMTSQVLPRTA